MTKSQKIWIGASVIILSGLIVWLSWGNYNRDEAPLVNAPSGNEAAVNSRPDNSTSPANTDSPTNSSAAAVEQVVAENLKIPWEIAFLPDGSMLVTERPGTLQRITPSRQAIPITGVRHIGEGGLLGLAIHPGFRQNQKIYLYLTTSAGSGLTNRVESYRLEGNTLSERQVIIEGIPGSSNHDGGRIAFGPDGLLYITTGDAETTRLAQDTNSLAGKILRLRDDGSLPSDNPFNSPVYSYGHRNPQGLAWDNQGRLWATEHGRSGAQSGFDELNLIEKGKNYGWPTIEGDKTQSGLERPIAHSGASTTWAPSGLAHLNGTLYFSGLRGQTLYVARIQNGPAVEIKNFLARKYGRLRAVTLGPDGFIYVSTSNTDGRGTQARGDDKIIRLSPQILQ